MKAYSLNNKMVFFVFSIRILSTAVEVRDFAPTTVGTEWKYLTAYSEEIMGETQWIDSQEVTIKITESIIKNKDTSLIFQYIKRSIIDTSWNDTVFVRNDSIFGGKGGNYFTDRIFPLWKCHSINYDSLQKGTFGNKEILFYKSTEGYGRSESFYAQNIGLYRGVNNYGRVAVQFYYSFRLVSFTPSPLLIYGPELKRKEVLSHRFGIIPLFAYKFINGSKLHNLKGQQKKYFLKNLNGIYIIK